MSTRKGVAFTLIELLVVIGIIAILAAILFPIFASSREAAKQSVNLSNLKQTGLAIASYLSDSDDTYPSAFSIDNGDGASVATGHVTVSLHGQPLGVGGVLAANDKWFTAIPAGANSAPLAPIDRSAWINATEPYRKGYEVTQMLGIATADAFPSSAMVAFVSPPATSSFTMNGLLSSLGANSIAVSSKCPLVWPGQGKWNFRGGSLISPYLVCDNKTLDPAPPCRFNPSGPSQTGGVLAGQTSGEQFGDGIWIYNTGWWIRGRGFSYVSTDLSAHFSLVGEGASHTQPFAHIDAKGYPNTSGGKRDVARCTTMSGGLQISYLSWFRPDSQYTYPIGDQPSGSPVPCGW